MQFPIHIELHHSRLLYFSLFLIHALAAVCALVMPWSWVLRSLLLALIGISAWHARHPSKIVGLRLFADGGFACLLAGDEKISAAVLPDSAVFNQLIVLRLRISDAKTVSSLVLLRGSMSAEQFRVLRLWLRWGAKSSAVGVNESAGKSV